MKTNNWKLAALLLFGALTGKAQTMEKSYSGWWAMTSWTFSFHKDGTYERESSGHYGQTHVAGTYMLRNDTVIMRNGFKDTNGTVNEKYLLDKEGMLIDLTLHYDYMPTDRKDAAFYNSKERK